MTTSTSTSDLASTLDSATGVSEIRDELSRLRDDGLSFLMESGSPSFPENWDKPESPITKILLRRAKHLAFRRGQLSDGGFPIDLPEVVLDLASDSPGERIPLFSSPDLSGPGEGPIADETSVFFASQYLRCAIDEPPMEDGAEGGLGYLPESIFFCLYRILRELLTAEVPEGYFGAAKAGESGATLSTFVTSECARAIGRMNSLFRSTAEIIVELGEVTSYIERVCECKEPGDASLPESWCDLELTRARTSLQTLLGHLGTRCLLRLDLVDERPDPRELASAIRSGARRFAARSREELESAVKQIEDFRDREGTQAASATNETPEVDVARISGRGRTGHVDRFLLEATAHEYSLRTLELIGEHLQVFEEHVEKREHAATTAAKDSLLSISEILSSTLDPVSAYMKSVMFESLWRIEHQGAVARIHDLVFAASTCGAIRGDWEQAVYRHAIDTVLRLLDPAGLLPPGPPFQVSSGGKEKRAVNVHAVRALAYLIQKSGHIPSVDEAKRLAAAFGAGLVRERGVVAWTRAGVGQRGRLSPWGTAVALVALDRVHRCLSESVNHTVLRCFRWKGPNKLEKVPRIRDLMCSDLGLAALDWGARDRTMITQDLEQIRAHILSRGRRSGPVLCSLIAYGPPGTGKTTLAESLAVSCRRPLVVVTPSDLVRDGGKLAEYRSELVMGLLGLLSECVILFDEFDAVISARDVESTPEPKSEFSFLTANMLPRLTKLHDAAQERSTGYILATNFIGRLDAAAIRRGRFDVRKGVYAPDLASRLARVVSQVQAVRGRIPNLQFEQGWVDRAAHGIARLGYVSTAVVASRDWLTAPRNEDGLRNSAFWSYVLFDRPEPSWPLPTVSGGWSSFQVPGKSYRAEHEICEALELGAVGEWERGAQVGRSTWSELRALASQDSGDCKADYEREMEKLRIAASQA